MLTWSNGKIKCTLGIGGFATTALMAELWKSVLPVWGVMSIALLPVVVFIFVRPGELPARIVRVAQTCAALWYILTVVTLLIAMLRLPQLPRGWPIYCVGVIFGLIPSIIVVREAIADREQR